MLIYWHLILTQSYKNALNCAILSSMSLRDVTNLLVALLFHSCVSSAVLEEGSPPLPRLLMIAVY